MPMNAKFFAVKGRVPDLGKGWEILPLSFFKVSFFPKILIACHLMKLYLRDWIIHPRA
jgi:hypothetical protein